jgi:hypothetical protein
MKWELGTGGSLDSGAAAVYCQNVRFCPDLSAVGIFGG